MRLSTIHPHTTKHKTFYIRFIWVVILAVAALFVASIVSPSLHRYWSQFGSISANAALILYIFTIIPGMLKRFQVSGNLQKIQLIFMNFRRQFGIGMYLFADFHSFWSRTLPTIKFNGNLAPQHAFEVAGLVAITLTLPLFLTSNNTSQRLLGKHWNTLHKLTHIAIWAIFAHLILQNPTSPQSIVISSITILQMFSFIRAKSRSSAS